ncbi:MAG: alkaline phosphatase D family protein, partial [Alphaproteobacteria bacterium]|nr:alkaline phosphatase D family protein [Alphaproteobacteria bacterium]
MNLRHGVAVIALLLGACATDSTISEAAVIAPLPVGNTVLTRIAFGSCADEEFAQPIWKAIAAADPDIFLFMGDNIYVDQLDGEFVENVTPQMISDAYELMARHPDYSPFRSAVPILAAWDDHDFGKNDGGWEFEFKTQSKEMMLDFFGVAADAAVRGRDGLYHATTFGPQGRRVQIIMLDTRWFRSPLTPTDEWGAPGKERYVVSTATEQIILGEAQWAWLDARLREPADLRLLVSSIQVISEGHGWELWRNLPAERQRFFELLRQTKVENLVLLSGDRHVGGLYRLEGQTGYPL